MALYEDIVSSLIVLVTTTKDNYVNSMNSVHQETDKTSNKIGYITVNKPFNSIIEDLKNNGLNPDKYFFVDCITATVQTPPTVHNCIFVSSPSALTDLGLAISSLFNEHGCEVILFDTISTLIVYQDIGSVTKFVHNIVTKGRVVNKKLVLIALKEDSEELIKDLNMFVDKVINL